MSRKIYDRNRTPKASCHAAGLRSARFVSESPEHEEKGVGIVDDAAEEMRSRTGRTDNNVCARVVGGRLGDQVLDPRGRRIQVSQVSGHVIKLPARDWRRIFESGISAGPFEDEGAVDRKSVGEAVFIRIGII